MPDRHPRIATFLESHPVDVDAMAAMLSIAVTSATLRSTEAFTLEAGPEDGWRLFVNRTLLDAQRRLAVAHGIANRVLHAGLIAPLIADQRVHRKDLHRRSELPDAIEEQADEYAAAVLMPAPAMIGMRWIGTRDTMALRVARTFGVPLPQARIRMARLGIAPPHDPAE